jgi:hypothetical protein
MPEHYTKNTLECTAWCPKCQDSTQHRVDGGRRGPCLRCAGVVLGEFHFTEAPRCLRCHRPFGEKSEYVKTAHSVKFSCEFCLSITSFAIDHEAAMSKKQLDAKRKRDAAAVQPGLFE